MPGMGAGTSRRSAKALNSASMSEEPEVESPAGQVRNLERIAEKLFGEVGLASIADALDGEETERRGTGDELRKGALRLAVVGDRPIE